MTQSRGHQRVLHAIHAGFRHHQADEHLILLRSHQRVFDANGIGCDPFEVKRVGLLDSVDALLCEWPLPAGPRTASA